MQPAAATTPPHCSSRSVPDVRFALCSGDSRVLRTDRVMALVTSPGDFELLELLMGADEHLATRLEARVQDDPTLPAYLVVDSVADQIYMHGNWNTSIDGQPMGEVEAERPSSFGQLTCCVDGASDEPVTFLVEGCVVAGGFTVFSDTADTPVARFELSNTPHESEPSGPTNETQTAGAAATPSVFDDPGIDLHHIGQRRSPAEAVEPAAVAPPEPGTVPRELEPQPALPEPAVASEQPGARAPDPRPAAPVATTALTPEPEVPAEATPSPGSGAPGFTFREPPSGRPTSASPQPAPAHAVVREPNEATEYSLEDHTIEPNRPVPQPSPIVTRRARVDFGEFGMVDVTAGLIVGRSPSTAPRPSSYDTLMVQDTKVSRAHLAIRVENDDLWVLDLGSSNGSVLRTTAGSAHDVPTSGAGLQVSAGDIVEFGSLTARFAGWTDDA